jgi:hypothetical protein
MAFMLHIISNPGFSFMVTTHGVILTLIKRVAVFFVGQRESKMGGWE